MRDLQRVRDGLSFDDKRLSSDDVVWPEVVGADATVFGHGKILPLREDDPLPPDRRVGGELEGGNF